MGYIGNVEWTSYYDPNNKPTPASSGSNEYYHSGIMATETTEHLLTEFISQEGIDGNWSRNEGTGALYSNSTDGSGALRRGGGWNGGTGLNGGTGAGVRRGSEQRFVGFGHGRWFPLRSPRP